MRGQNGGPKTKPGKTIVSRNAIKHGITSTLPVIPGMEREEDWIRHRDAILDSFQPEGGFEQFLAHRIAFLAWRLQRVARYELAVISAQLSTTEEHLAFADAYIYGPGPVLEQAEGKRHDLPEPTEDELAQCRELRIIPWKDNLDNIMRHESQLHRQLLQTHHELEALQARRRGEPVHLARLDISSPPAI